MNAFWTLTAFPVAQQISAFNPASPYTISSQSHPFKSNEDGTLTLYLQKNRPEDVRAENWMPIPEGRFFLLLQLYQPKEEVLKGQWPSPKIIKMNSGTLPDSASAQLPGVRNSKQFTLVQASDG